MAKIRKVKDTKKKVKRKDKSITVFSCISCSDCGKIIGMHSARYPNKKSWQTAESIKRKNLQFVEFLIEKQPSNPDVDLSPFIRDICWKCYLKTLPKNKKIKK